MMNDRDRYLSFMALLAFITIMSLTLYLIILVDSAEGAVCVWTIGGDWTRADEIRDNSLDFWNQNSNAGSTISSNIGWQTCWPESLCVGACPSGSCPHVFLWDALADECPQCQPGGDDCAPIEYVRRTTRQMSMVWFDMTGIPAFVSLDSAICSLYVQGQIGLNSNYKPTCGSILPGRLDVIADTINQDWVEGDASPNPTVGPTTPCYLWSNSNKRGLPQPDISDNHWHSVGATSWECDDQDWDKGPHFRDPMEWLGAGTDTVVFDETTVAEIPGYFGWNVTGIAQDMYNQQVTGTSETGFGIAFYDTTFWSPGVICESANTSISFNTRESGQQGFPPKLVLWYHCEGPAEPDTVPRPQVIYIND